MATIGRRAAVVQMLGGRTMTGVKAQLAWGTVHLALLPTNEDRAKAVVDWAGAAMTHQRAGRITRRGRSSADHDPRVEPRGGAEPDGVHAGVPHHPRVARRCAAGADADRELPGPAARRPGCDRPREALVEGGRGDVRRRRRNRNRALVRVRPSLAGVHRAVRRGVRRPLRDRGYLLLPRGDLSRHLHLRLEPPVAVGALLVRGARRRSRASAERSRSSRRTRG